MARKHVMTPARRAALRKAQLASAAKRHGMRVSRRPNAVIVSGSIYPLKKIAPTHRKRKGRLTKTQNARLMRIANLAGVAIGTGIAVRMNRPALTGAKARSLRFGKYVRSTRGAGSPFYPGRKALG